MTDREPSQEASGSKPRSTKARGSTGGAGTGLKTWQTKLADRIGLYDFEEVSPDVWYETWNYPDQYKGKKMWTTQSILDQRIDGQWELSDDKLIPAFVHPHHPEHDPPLEPPLQTLTGRPARGTASRRQSTAPPDDEPRPPPKKAKAPAKKNVRELSMTPDAIKARERRQLKKEALARSSAELTTPSAAPASPPGDGSLAALFGDADDGGSAMVDEPQEMENEMGLVSSRVSALRQEGVSRGGVGGSGLLSPLVEMSAPPSRRPSLSTVSMDTTGEAAGVSMVGAGPSGVGTEGFAEGLGEMPPTEAIGMQPSPSTDPVTTSAVPTPGDTAHMSSHPVPVAPSPFPPTTTSFERAASTPHYVPSDSPASLPGAQAPPTEPLPTPFRKPNPFDRPPPTQPSTPSAPSMPPPPPLQQEPITVDEPPAPTNHVGETAYGGQSILSGATPAGSPRAPVTTKDDSMDVDEPADVKPAPTPVAAAPAPVKLSFKKNKASVSGSGKDAEKTGPPRVEVKQEKIRELKEEALSEPILTSSMTPREKHQAFLAKNGGGEASQKKREDRNADEEDPTPRTEDKKSKGPRRTSEELPVASTSSKKDRSRHPDPTASASTSSRQPTRPAKSSRKQKDRDSSDSSDSGDEKPGRKSRKVSESMSGERKRKAEPEEEEERHAPSSSPLTPDESEDEPATVSPKRRSARSERPSEAKKVKKAKKAIALGKLPSSDEEESDQDMEPVLATDDGGPSASSSEPAKKLPTLKLTVKPKASSSTLPSPSDPTTSITFPASPSGSRSGSDKPSASASASAAPSPKELSASSTSLSKSKSSSVLTDVLKKKPTHPPAPGSGASTPKIGTAGGAKKTGLAAAGVAGAGAVSGKGTKAAGKSSFLLSLVGDGTGAGNKASPAASKVSTTEAKKAKEQKAEIAKMKAEYFAEVDKECSKPLDIEAQANVMRNFEIWQIANILPAERLQPLSRGVGWAIADKSRHLLDPSSANAQAAMPFPRNGKEADDWRFRWVEEMEGCWEDEEKVREWVRGLPPPPTGGGEGMGTGGGMRR